MLQIFINGLVFFRDQAVPVFSLFCFTLLLCVPVFLQQRKQKRKLPYLTLAIFTLASLIFRLSTIHDLYLPLYFDSAEHLRIINKLLQNSASLFTLTPTYYHIGFHIISAVLSTVLDLAPEKTVLILGQIILALLPLPVFLLIWQKTRSEISALFSALLASFAWSMPGFAINWGKYPMLMGLLLASVTLHYADQHDKGSTMQRIILSLGITASILTHSRVLIFFTLAGISWLLVQKIPVEKRRFSLGFGLASVLLLGVPIHNNNLLKLTLEPYLQSPGIYVTLIVFLLPPFAYKKAPEHTLFSIFLITGLFVSLFIPLGTIAGIPSLTLLDRPFVETILYLPLAILGGLGTAGFGDIFPAFGAKKLIAVILLGIFTLFSLQRYNFAPSPCCNFVSTDDIHAMTWIEENIPANSNIAIAAEPLTVMPSNTIREAQTPTDAGVWITNLTKRRTPRIPYTTDFSNPETIALLCQKNIDYLYGGNQAHSFNKSLYSKDTDWYQEVLSLPQARIFAITGCAAQ